MPRRTDRRRAGVIAVSALFHLAVLAALALKPAASSLRLYDQESLAVALVPLYLVPPKAPVHSRQAPAPIRPRPARLRVEDAAVTPLYAPPAPGKAATPSVQTGADTHPALQPSGPRAEIGRALKFGGVGCDAPNLVGMSRADRDRCAERLGAGAKTATYMGQGLSREKQRLFDDTAALKKANRDWREAPMPPGLATSDAAGGITGLGDAKPTRAHPF